MDGQAAQFNVGGEPLGNHIWGKKLPLLLRYVSLYDPQTVRPTVSLGKGNMSLGALWMETGPSRAMSPGSSA
jgi:hypothetical protein